MGVDKIEEIEIALSVAHHAVEIVDLKQTQIAMIILNAFLLELGALFGRELVSFFAATFGARSLKLMISEERFATVGAHSIGATMEFHLEDTEIDSQLQFVPAVEPEDFAHFDGAIFVRPILQDRIQVQAHPEKMIEHLVFNCQSS